jgi:hypothetical protein
MKDIRISPDDDGIDDITLEDGAFKWAKDGTQVANHHHIRSQVFKGTLDLNGRLSNKELKGVDFYGVIFDTSKTQSEKELELKKIIMQTPGYRALTYFSWSQTNHTVSVEAKIQSDWGELTLSSATTPL